MINKNKKRNKEYLLIQDNKGSAIVVVIIAMAFIGVLVSVLMYTSLLNYQMKRNNYSAKNNFYSAETVLDEIRLGIQGEISGAIGTSYQYILSNFDESDDKQFRMRYLFLSQIQSDYMAGDNANTYNLDTLSEYLSDTEEGTQTVLETQYNGVTYTITKIGKGGDSSDTVTKTKTETKTELKADGSTVTTTDTTPMGASDIAMGSMKLYNGSIVLENLKVTYTDASGYVSIISTDLRITVPDMDFAESVSLPSITAYSIIAQNSLLVYPDKISGEPAESTVNTVQGSIYCGGLTVGSLPNETNLKPGGVTLKLTEEPLTGNSEKRVIINGELVIGEKSRLETDSFGELWAGSISMHGSGGETDSAKYSSITFGGNSVYVADNMNIYGDGNKLTAGGDDAGGNKGQYIGFGTGIEASDSSAIIVNGVNTEIDVSKLTNLTLAGNAYVGIGGTDSLNQSTSDIVMGQSIAVKSDQIAYLVPADCIGIDKETGKQVSSSITNPMSLDTYETYIKGKSDVYEVSDSVECSSLDGKTLKDFGIVTTDSSKKVMYQRYIKQVSSNLSLVYYYVMFDSSSSISMQNANKYFAAYYNNNKSTLDAYSGLYTTGIVMRGDSDGFYTLHLAGNVVRYDSTGGNSLKEATLADDNSNAGYKNLLNNSQMKFEALCKKMLDSYDLLAASEKTETANAYNNLVKETQIRNYFLDVMSDTSITEKSDAKYFTQGAYTACVVDGEYNYTGTGKDNFNGLILATGDVTVSADFEGTIISGGTITLARDVDVKTNKDAVLGAMSAVNEVNGQKVSVTDFLVGGSGYLGGTTSKTYSEDSVDLGDLVSYENWKKQ
jgi:hypothetical protein